MGTGNLPKVWTDQENLTNEALNENFQYLLDQQSPIGTDGMSADVNEMQLQTSPGDLGSESLATSLKGEIERIRFQLAQIIGKDFWYQQPSVSLESISGAFGVQTFLNRVASGTSRANGFPIYLKASGAGLGLTLDCSTPFRCYIKGVLFTQESDLNTTMAAAPSTANTMLLNDADMAGADFSKGIGDLYSLLKVSYGLEFDAVGANIVSMAGKVAAFKKGTEYMIGFLKQASAGQASLVDVKRGFFFSPTQDPIPSVALTNNDVFTVMRLGWTFYRNAAGVASIFVSYDQPVYGPVAPVTLTIGAMWLDTSTNIWKRYDGVQFVDYDCTFIGMVLADATNCVAARSLEYFVAYSSNNTVKVTSTNSGGAIQIYPNGTASVSGKLIQIGPGGKTILSTDTDPDGGTFPANTQVTGYLYVFLDGSVKISTIAPAYRPEMFGFYHPYANARAMAAFAWNGPALSLVDKFFNFSPEYDIKNATAAVLAYNAAANNTWQTVATSKLMWTGKNIKVIFNGTASAGGFLRLSTASGAASFNYRIRINALDGSGESFVMQGGYTQSPATTAVDLPLGMFQTTIEAGALLGSVIPVNPFTQLEVLFQVFSANTNNTLFIQSGSMFVMEEIGRVF